MDNNVDFSWFYNMFPEPTQEEIEATNKSMLEHYTKEVETLRDNISNLMQCFLNTRWTQKNYSNKEIIDFIVSQDYIKYCEDFTDLFGYTHDYDWNGNVIASKQLKDYKKDFLFLVKKYFLAKKEVLHYKRLLNII